MAVIVGTSGNNFLVGTAGDDQMYGGDGQDTFNGLNGDDMMFGEGGDDYLRGQGDNDTLFGGVGNDYLRGDAGVNYLDGGDGADRAGYFLSEIGVVVSLMLQGQQQDTGFGLDTLVSIENLSGTPHDDSLTGDDGSNVIWGSGGSDRLFGLGGNDLLETNDGDQYLDGGDGNDTVGLVGEEVTGAMTVSLSRQGAAQNTGVGMWTLIGIENLSGSVYDDHFTGDDGANVVAGAGAHDTLVGGGGDDLLLGDGSIDGNYTYGFSGSALITEDAGYGGNDSLDGGKGDDRLVGGGGDDMLTGGKGGDRFEFATGSGNDHILDYEKKDVIAIDADGVDDFGDLTIVDLGRSAVISWGTGDSITLDGFKASKLSADNFDFGEVPATAFAAAALDFGEGLVGDIGLQRGVEPILASSWLP